MLENISGSSIKAQFKSNNKLRIITYAVGGLVVLSVGYFLYTIFIWKKLDNKETLISFVLHIFAEN